MLAQSKGHAHGRRFAVSILPSEEAWAINDTGLILAITGGPGNLQPAVFRNGKLRHVISPCVRGEKVVHPGTYINNLGSVAGTCSVRRDSDSDGQDCHWDSSGRCHILRTLGGKYSYAMGINNKDQIIGASETGRQTSSHTGSGRDSFQQHACLWDGKNVIDLDIKNKGNSVAIAIDDEGKIVIERPSGGPPVSPFRSTYHLLHQGKEYDLQTGREGYRPIRINRSGSLLFASNGDDYSAIVSGDKVQRIADHLGRAVALDFNDMGQVVGQMHSMTLRNDWGTPDLIGFFYDGKTLFDLNDLLIKDERTIITCALSINNFGQIVASGRSKQTNITYAVLLKPTY